MSSESKTTIETASGAYLDSIFANAIQRKSVKRTLCSYLWVQFHWWIRGEHFRAEWVRYGNLPPDWYREETDAEFRKRVQERIDAQ